MVKTQNIAHYSTNINVHKNAGAGSGITGTETAITKQSDIGKCNVIFSLLNYSHLTYCVPLSQAHVSSATTTAMSMSMSVDCEIRSAKFCHLYGLLSIIFSLFILSWRSWNWIIVFVYIINFAFHKIYSSSYFLVCNYCEQVSPYMCIFKIILDCCIQVKNIDNLKNTGPLLFRLNDIYCILSILRLASAFNLLLEVLFHKKNTSLNA